MNILHVLPALTKGGAERVAVDLANQTASEGHRVAMLLAYPVERSWLQDDLDPRIELRFIRRTKSRFGAYTSALIWLVRNRGWIGSFDIVHCHLTFASMLGAWVRQLRNLGNRRRPVIVETYHSVGMPLAAPMKRLHRWLAGGHDGVVVMAVDREWDQFLKARPTLHSAFIPNGVHVPAIASKAQSAEVRAWHGIPEKAPVCGTVSRLVTARRVDEVMEIFFRLAEREPDLHVLIGGDGPRRSDLEAKAAEAGMADRFHFSGLVTSPDELLPALGLYLTFNVGAVTGIAALEAAARGVPVVAYQTLADHRPGAEDWIYSSSDPALVADRAAELLADREQRSDLAQSQRAIVIERFSATRMTADYLQLYADLLRNR